MTKDQDKFWCTWKGCTAYFTVSKAIGYGGSALPHGWFLTTTEDKVVITCPDHKREIDMIAEGLEFLQRR
jgi:hypothetical protein